MGVILTAMGSALTRSPLPLVRYRLTRAALDLRSFTVAELASMTAAPVNTVYSFLSELGSGVAQESLPATTPGRPRKIYSLTRLGFERLLAENFEIMRMIQEAGIEAPQSRGAVPASTQAQVAPGPRESRPGMKLESLRKLYIEELKDLYSAEKQILQALPKMASKTRNEELRRAFEAQAQETERQIERLDRIFEMLDKNPRGKKSKGMEGLIEEGKEILQEDMEPEVQDAALLSAAQKIEHYEIAGYGTVRTYAQLLGEGEQARLLQQTLDEQGNADKKLTRLAESSINVEIEARV
jgi:ferritin-like metal-binding protein YciE